MLVIRLRRIGRKHDPHYRIVVAEHTAPVQGKFIAEIGHFHPKSKETVIRQEELTSWLNKGAKPSNSVAKLCERTGISHKLIAVKQYHGQPKKKAQEVVQAKTEKSAPKPAEEVTNTTPEDTSEEPIVTEGISEPEVTEANSEEESSSDEATGEEYTETDSEAPES